MPEKNEGDIMKQIATRVSESTYDEIEKQAKEKGFRSKSDFVANAVEVYIKGDTSPTSDASYIPKSRVTAQYQNVLSKIDELKKMISENDSRLQLITVLTFYVAFKFTRQSRFRLSKGEVNAALQKISALAESENGITSSDLQTIVNEIISSDPTTLRTNVKQQFASTNGIEKGNDSSDELLPDSFKQLTVSTFDETKLSQKECIDAWHEFSKTYHSPEERNSMVREIVYLENSYHDPAMKKLEDESNGSMSTERGRAYGYGRLAIRNDIYYKAYHQKSGYWEPGVDPGEYLSEWSDKEGHFIIPERYKSEAS